MKIKTFLAAVLAASFVVQIFTPSVRAANNDCTPLHPCRGGDRRDA
ncbi:MAG: hypothetical protein KME52_28280 [Desmonostoc geniculatum HA4340-LM1]|nr:hypothetical protein [Desmonostoc geniculatum HA4340-LM1]